MFGDERPTPSSFFFNDTATTEIYTLSLHDALPIFPAGRRAVHSDHDHLGGGVSCLDRKSTRLNSSHLVISYAVFCLKKKTVVLGRYPTSLLIAAQLAAGPFGPSVARSTQLAAAILR